MLGRVKEKCYEEPPTSKALLILETVNIGVSNSFGEGEGNYKGLVQVKQHQFLTGGDDGCGSGEGVYTPTIELVPNERHPVKGIQSDSIGGDVLLLIIMCMGSFASTVICFNTCTGKDAETIRGRTDINGTSAEKVSYKEERPITIMTGEDACLKPCAFCVNLGNRFKQDWSQCAAHKVKRSKGAIQNFSSYRFYENLFLYSICVFFAYGLATMLMKFIFHKRHDGYKGMYDCDAGSCCAGCLASYNHEHPRWADNPDWIIYGLRKKEENVENLT